jgi:hypothetical protein
MSRRFWHRWQLALLSTSLLSTATVLVACGGHCSPRGVGAWGEDSL